VRAPGDAGVAALRGLFERAHEERYGYTDPEGAIEIVNLRVSAAVPRERAAGRLPPAATPRRATRDADFDGLRVRTAVLGGPPQAGEQLAGPAILELEEATVVVPPGRAATSDPAGAVLLDRAAGGA
jgi:N-methylhydantoinase A